MKLQTKIDDLKKAIAAKAAEAKAEADSVELTARMKYDARDALVAVLDRSIASRTGAAIAAETLAKVPLARRTIAATTATTALEIGRSAALIGECYSGETTYGAKWSALPEPSASTNTRRGDQYSRKCTYHKTDADHIVSLSPEWTPLLVEREELRLLSERDGLPLIGISGDGRVSWVKRKGKSITAEVGWIAYFGQVCYHSTESQAAADKGLFRKLAAMRREWSEEQLRRADRAQSEKEERRARLIARLCSHVTATLADARALGFCAPGIEQFQAQHGIGNTAPLPALVRTGNPHAVRLALAIARKVRREPSQIAA